FLAVMLPAGDKECRGLRKRLIGEEEPVFRIEFVGCGNPDASARWQRQFSWNPTFVRAGKLQHFTGDIAQNIEQDKIFRKCNSRQRGQVVWRENDFQIVEYITLT